jgi:hypothetical protein
VLQFKIEVYTFCVYVQMLIFFSSNQIIAPFLLSNWLPLGATISIHSTTIRNHDASICWKIRLLLLLVRTQTSLSLLLAYTPHIHVPFIVVKWFTLCFIPCSSGVHRRLNWRTCNQHFIRSYPGLPGGRDIMWDCESNYVKSHFELLVIKTYVMDLCIRTY